MGLDPFTMSLLISGGSALLGAYANQDDGDPLSQVSNYTPGQEGFLNDYTKQAQSLQGGYGKAVGYLQQFLDPDSSVYKNFENQALNQLNTKTLPMIAERYAGAGALSSSGFGQALGAGAADAYTNLASLKSGLGMQAAGALTNNYQNSANTVLGAQPFSYVQQDQSPGFLPNALHGFANNLNQGALNGFGQKQQSYQSQYPLTNYYDQTFRAQGVY